MRFFKNGQWRNVVIDDRIPCDQTGTPIYARSRDPTEIWVCLVEKVPSVCLARRRRRRRRLRPPAAPRAPRRPGLRSGGGGREQPASGGERGAGGGPTGGAARGAGGSGGDGRAAPGAQAYAKLHGCYEALANGSMTYALRDLTGGAPQARAPPALRPLHSRPALARSALAPQRRRRARLSALGAGGAEGGRRGAWADDLAAGGSGAGPDHQRLPLAADEALGQPGPAPTTPEASWIS